MYCPANFGCCKAADWVNIVGHQIVLGDILGNPVQAKEEGKNIEIVVPDALMHRIVFLKERMCIDYGFPDCFMVSQWSREIWSIDCNIRPRLGRSGCLCPRSRSIDRKGVQVHMERNDILIDPHALVDGKEAGTGWIGTGWVEFEVETLLKPHNISQVVVEVGMTAWVL